MWVCFVVWQQGEPWRMVIERAIAGGLCGAVPHIRVLATLRRHFFWVPDGLGSYQTDFLNMK